MISEAALLPVGFAIDRLEGDGIKQIREERTPLERSVGCLCTASTKKINSIAMLAELYFFCCLRCWLFTHNVHYRTFFRACPEGHKQSQKVRSEPIRPHYVI